MLSIAEARKALGDPTLTDAEVENLRDQCHVWVSILIEIVDSLPPEALEQLDRDAEKMGLSDTFDASDH